MMALRIICGWFVTAYAMHLMYFTGFFHAFITWDFWRGVFFAALLIFIFEAAFKYSLGMEGDEYLHTYVAKLWKLVYALYERIFHKAELEKTKLAKDIKKRF